MYRVFFELRDPRFRRGPDWRLLYMTQQVREPGFCERWDVRPEAGPTFPLTSLLSPPLEDVGTIDGVVVAREPES